jgi:glycosyltransferase involved in cell wall biosynthesis
MRILMLTQFYWPVIGGEERLVQDLSLELARRGHEVAVATLWHEGLPKFELDQGVRVYRIRGLAQRARWLFSEPGRRHAPPWPDPEALQALRWVMEQERPEIVHAHNWLVYSFLPLKLWSQARLVMTLHDYSLVCAQKRLVRKDVPCNGPGFAKCLACASDHYGLVKGVPVTLSNWVMGAVERAAVDMYLPISQAVAIKNGLVANHLPFQVIPNFVPNDIGDHIADSDPHLEQLPQEDFLLFVGDLSRDKGIEVLLHAYAELVNPPPLVLIGRRCADTPAAFPPNVIVLGSWPHEAVMAAWQRSSIALIPSTWPEPFGIVAIEAMAASRPVIASLTGGLPDIVVDGETSFLVSPGDPNALRQAMERLIADRELRECMGRAGRRRVAEFQASTVVPRIEQVYQTLIAKAHRAETVMQSDEGYWNAETQ